MSRNKKIILSLILAAVLALAVYLIFNFINRGPKTEAKGFDASIIEIRDDLIIGTGRYFTAEDHIIEGESVEVEILITPDTKFIKHIYYLPTEEEFNKYIEETGDQWYPADKMKQERSTVLLADLINDSIDTINFPIFVRSEDNIFNKTKITASEVIYTLEIISNPYYYE